MSEGLAQVLSGDGSAGLMSDVQGPAARRDRSDRRVAKRAASVYETIRDDIISGGSRPMSGWWSPSWPSGTAPRPTRCAKRCSCCAAQGFVLIAHNQGARVRPIDQDFVRDIYEIGVLIEPALARWFVGMATRRGHRRTRAHPGRDRGQQLRRPGPAQRTRHRSSTPHVRAPLQPARGRTLVEAPRGAARRERAASTSPWPAARR